MSNVCKFFQTNSCRYGNRCRFRHVYEEPQSYDPRSQHNYDSRSQHNYDSRSQHNYNSRSQHNYDSRSQQGGTSILKSGVNITKTIYNPQPRDDIVIKKLTEDVSLAVKSSEEQGIWPLSCFSHIQSLGNLEGFDDISPEELRCRAYEAIANGKFQAYVEETQVLLKKAAAVRSLFIGKGPTAMSILKAYADGIKIENTQFAYPQSSFQEPSTFGVSKQSDFHIQNQQQQTSDFNTNLFGQALRTELNEMQTSPFASVFFNQHNVNVPELPMTTFGHTQTGPPSDLFNQNIFGNVQSPANGNSSFFLSQPSVLSTPFNQSTFSSQPNHVSMNVLYSQMGDLTTEEVEQYKATTFTYGKTPLKPPPKELC